MTNPAQIAATYLVTAYRWGATNGHSYIVYCGPDATVADNLAAMEPDDRGGKYGCQVVRYTEDGGAACQKAERIAYYPSAYGEESPSRNWRIDYFEALGHTLDDYIEGRIYVAKEGSTVLETRKVEHPTDELLHNEVMRKRKFYKAMEEQTDDQ